jgi:hypothetical protein
VGYEVVQAIRENAIRAYWRVGQILEGGCALRTATRDTWGCVWTREMCMGTLIFIIESTDSSCVSQKEAVVRRFRELLALLPFAGRICQFIIFQKMKGLRAESASLPFPSLPFPSLLFAAKMTKYPGHFALRTGFWCVEKRVTPPECRA